MVYICFPSIWCNCTSCLCRSRLRLLEQNNIDSWLKQQTFVFSQSWGADVRSGAPSGMSGETLPWPHLLPSPQSSGCPWSAQERDRSFPLHLPVSSHPLLSPPFLSSPRPPLFSTLSLPLLRRPRILLMTSFSLHYPLKALVSNRCMGAGLTSSHDLGWQGGHSSVHAHPHSRVMEP